MSQQEPEQKQTRCVIIRKPRYIEHEWLDRPPRWHDGLRVVERGHGGVYIQRFDRWGDVTEHLGVNAERSIAIQSPEMDKLGHTLVDFDGQWRIDGSYVEGWERQMADGPPESEL